MDDTPTPAQLHSVQVARRRLGIGTTKFYELINSGALASVQIGTRRLIPETAIQDYVAGLGERRSA